VPTTAKVEIPDNLSKLSAKELMKILDSLGVKRDDCFEKTDLIKRITEYQESQPGFKKPP
jgi:small GTP-binding protein